MTPTPTLHLICGQAGAGKTTYAKRLESEAQAIRFSKDEWIITLYGRELSLEEWSQNEPRCYACIESISRPLLKRGLDVIWDFGLWYREERKKAAEFARTSGANCIVHYLDTPTELRLTRVAKRNQSDSDDSVGINEEDFNRQLDWFEAPTDDEDYVLKVITPSR